VSQNFRRRRRANVGDDLFLLCSCRDGNISSGALMHCEKNFG
jgi:hypothetical protein